MQRVLGALIEDESLATAPLAFTAEVICVALVASAVRVRSLIISHVWGLR